VVRRATEPPQNGAHDASKSRQINTTDDGVAVLNKALDKGCTSNYITLHHGNKF
jgi:hypothetical protein